MASEEPSETHICPYCGESYEPKYDNPEDAPPRSIGKEQHMTGICSDDCWDAFLGGAPDE